VLAAVIPEHSRAIGDHGVVFQAAISPNNCTGLNANDLGKDEMCPIIETVRTGIVPASAAVQGVPLAFKLVLVSLKVL
jgi:hypothetical protein